MACVLASELTPEELEKRRAYHREWMRAWRKANPEKKRASEAKYRASHQEQVKAYHRAWGRAHRQQVLAWNRARALRNRAILQAFYAGGCYACSKPWEPIKGAWHSHHIVPETKRFNVGDGLMRSPEAIRAELAKCVCLCSSCHMRVTNGTLTLIPPDQQ